MLISDIVYDGYTGDNLCKYLLHDDRAPNCGMLCDKLQEAYPG